jgi:hypothetical protein
MMTASSNVARKWKPSLADVDEMDAACRCYRHRDQKIEAYAKSVGASADELLAWAGKITAALKARPPRRSAQDWQAMDAGFASRYFAPRGKLAARQGACGENA